MAQSPTSCTGTASSDVSLPVVEGAPAAKNRIRKSRSGRRRAIVLATVQILIIVHIVLWALSRHYGWWGGRTLSPIEPSESMEFTKHGVINAGLVFFALALVATMIFGRWFCGWGCHLVLLQDLCGWFMKKMGIRPKPFRSRLLVYVPLILALYLFIWPLFYRFAVAPWLQPDLHTPGISSQLITEDFWKTFAGVAVAIPFLGICGFATVYFLGAKGFCTYGCPYGGFFAPLDELAVGRIRVTDACEQCGHCTAVCTSNVRVHEEVHQYGMVVDVGCMKCLDCVSVCPNDALYYGLGRPAAFSLEPREAPPKKVYDLTWPEEIAFGTVFTLSFFAMRSVYGLVPLLMAAGIAGCVTFITWKLWRMLRSESVNLYRYRLKYKGTWTRSGRVFTALVVLTLLFTAHCGAVNAAFRYAQRHDRRVPDAPDAVFAGQTVTIDDDVMSDAQRAIGGYRIASTIGTGGIGLPWPDAAYKETTWQGELDFRTARLQLAQLDLAGAERTLRRAIERDGNSERLCKSLMWVLRALGRHDEALAYALGVIERETTFDGMLADLAQEASRRGAMDPVIEVCTRRIERDPDDDMALRWLSLLQLDAGRMDEGIALLRRRIERDPEDARVHAELGMALAGQGKVDEALEETRRAVELDPDNVTTLLQLGGLLETTGRADEAVEFFLRADELQQDHAH